QAGADEQNKSKNGFGDDETVAQTAAMSAGSRTASTFIQRFSQLGFRADQRRYETEEDSCEDRNTKGHRKHPQVEIDLTKSRHGVAADHAQKIESPDGEQHSRGCPQYRQ